MTETIALIGLEKGQSKMKKVLIASISTIVLFSPVRAQSFDQFIGFGDSTIDSGYFRYVSRGTAQEARYANARANGGAITPSGGLMNSDYLSARFGLTAIPVSAPGGGTNYAVSGARINAQNLGGDGSPSIAQQMTNYLAANGGHANPNALYLITGGGNDFTALENLTGQAYLNAIATIGQAQIDSITNLSRAGARYMIVPNFNGAGARAVSLGQTVWSGLSANGVRFIPADNASLRLTVQSDPARFGFTQVLPYEPGRLTAACRLPNANAVAAGMGLFCIPSLASAGAGLSSTAYLTSASALQTSYYSDDQHFSPAGQKIQADYYYSLVVAPSQISFLTETSIQMRRDLNAGIQQQLDISQRSKAPGLRVWFNGDIAYLKLNNSAPGFPSDPSTPATGTIGLNYATADGGLLGAALSYGGAKPTFSFGGGFNQDDVSISVYGGLRRGPAWSNVILSYGFLHSDVNRVVPLGISFDNLSGSTRGHNFSVAALAGFDFVAGALTHGPIVGLEVQAARFNPFTETGGVTALAFSNIGRDSIVSAIGYRVAYDVGSWRPFAQLTYNHEFDRLNSEVTAALTTVTAPSYSMPIVRLGRNWGMATVGTTVDFGRGFTGFATFNSAFAQNNVTHYGGRFGLNYAFNVAPSDRLAKP
jgi:outer membrane lipase/esterase